jgi:uncharacterized protein (DUF2235 family)
VPKNIIVACDGTNNEFGEEDTNVVRLIQSLNQDPQSQLMYYDPGVGTLPEPGWISRIGRTISTVAGLAFGAGLSWKVSEAYRFLMAQWEPGDRVYLFGFSRGAYTVRVLAGFLHMFGLLHPGNDNLLPYAFRLFKAARSKLESDVKARGFWTLCSAYRHCFARDVPGSSDRRFPTHFMGVWDTVSSVGWAWDPIKYLYTAKNPSISSVRHAVSIDERRWFFRQNLFTPCPGQNMEERWFPGVHCDVGGGYPEDQGGLWREAFTWIRDEAVAAGLSLDHVRAERALSVTAPPQSPWLEPKHESLTAWWWPAEFFPKMVYHPDTKRRYPEMGFGRHRTIPLDALPHKSTLARLRDARAAYYPPNIPVSWPTRPLPPAANL